MWVSGKSTAICMETGNKLRKGSQPKLKRGKNNMGSSSCDMCVNYVYDEDYECYTCLVNLDEDEMYRFLSGSQRECPYFRLDDEYGVVRHQL